MSAEKNIHIHSDEVQEILGTPPRWIIRRGITVMLLVVGVLIAGSYFYKYPDFISSRVTILSKNPPVQIVAKSNGKIDRLFVSNNQQVKKGDLLGVIENTADYSDAYRLMQKLDSIEGCFEHPGKFGSVVFKENYSLGNYHSFYASFISQLKQYQTFLRFNSYDQRIQSLEKQVNDYHVFYERSEEQLNVLKQDYDLAYDRFRRDSVLFHQELLSEADYERAMADMLKQRFDFQDLRTSLANTQITINNLQQQIREQQVEKSEKENELLAFLEERYGNLTNQLAGWEQAFILKTPIAGQVTFTRFWSENQYVSAGEPVFTVVPGKRQEIIGRALVPIEGAGKAETGQRVKIKLDNYPHMEFGIVEGRVTNISKVPVNLEQGTFYTVEIALVNHLKTNYGKDLPFNQEMQGVAEIVTKERRLIQRVMDPFISVARENF